MKAYYLTCVLLASALAFGCSDSDGASNNANRVNNANTNNVNNSNNANTNNANNANNGGLRVSPLIHNFGTTTLNGGQEVTRCAQWTFNNDKPIYVNKVTLANDGWYHHSNWIVVPETKFEGEDGFFRCSERNYDELGAAISGTVLFAQSTQSREETQDLPDGVVIKIPPRHKVIAGVHLLNLSPREEETGLIMELELIHPGDVEVVATPFRLSFYDLDLPPNQESHFISECLFANKFRDRVGDFKFDLYWVLPHYHALGNLARLEVAGGPQDGEVIYELEGFNAEANGKVFDPPLDLSAASGLRFTCGFNNPRDVRVGWGIGDQEMCVMLGLAKSDLMFDASVLNREDIGESGGIDINGGECGVLTIPKTAGQAAPTEEEIAGELYVPASDADRNNVVEIPDCVDVKGDEPPRFMATLGNIHNDVLMPSCAFSSCHDAENPAFGLDLETREGLRERLLNHSVRHETELPLVEPGNATGSWLYQIVASCEPDASGSAVAYMPRNSPTLMEPGTIAMIREWIDQGATE